MEKGSGPERYTAFQWTAEDRSALLSLVIHLIDCQPDDLDEQTRNVSHDRSVQYSKKTMPLPPTFAAPACIFRLSSSHARTRCRQCPVHSTTTMQKKQSNSPPSDGGTAKRASPPKSIARDPEKDARNMRSYKERVRRRLFASVIKREAEEEAEAVAQLGDRETFPGDVVESFGGALLDSDIAGPGFAPANDLDMFETGVALFYSGRYERAVAVFEAVEKATGGSGTRRGGQVALWRAQAIYAVGGEEGRRDTGRILAGLETHADADVGKAAAELRYILSAPELPMAPGSDFHLIPTLEETEGLTSGPRWLLAQSGIGRVKQSKSERPEKYSLEWYLEKARPEAPEGNRAELMLFAVVLLASAAFLTSAFYNQQGNGS
jgi:hypothetical protein